MKHFTLHTDKYQINMMYAYWLQGTHNRRAAFEAYFRRMPFGNGFAVFAGLERIVRYIQDLSFTEDDIRYLSEQEERYDPGFLEELRNFRFTGDIHAVPEGTVVFANEPLIRVEARIFEAQLVETAMLNFMNYQTLIATKAARIKHVAPNDVLLEFGTRRAQEADAAIWGARAAYIAGFHATSNMKAGQLFGIPTKGTHAHAWIQMHDSEEEAFRLYADSMPDQVSLLVDTYDTLTSGVPNAIRIAQYLAERGKRMQSIRIDSGDLAYASKRAREMLDEAGFPDVKIIASNDLDENIILNLKAQGARIDIWGVGTQLITAADQPSLGGVYKLAAREKDGAWEPVIKISNNPEKITNPGIKDVWRIVDRKTGKAVADYIALADGQRRPVHDSDAVSHSADVSGTTSGGASGNSQSAAIVHSDSESIRAGQPLELFDPRHPYRSRTVRDYEATPLLQPIFVDGKQRYELPDIERIRQYHASQLQLFWPEYLRTLNPEVYRVTLSRAAWDLRVALIERYQKKGDR